MVATAVDTYWKVADLVQKGKSDEARALAVAIPEAHLRGLALLLVNYSQHFNGRPDGLGSGASLGGSR